VRPSIRRAGLVILVAATTPLLARAQEGSRPPRADRVRLAEARQLAARVCDRLWPGWGRTGFQILLVSDSAEFLFGPEERPADFTPLGYDTVVGAEVWTRPRQFPPTLLANFPAVAGRPTVVIGSAERTGKSSTAWVLTLMHEHFHQWQNSQPDYYPGVSRLGLTRGDTTGRWMLDYPFPYDSAPVQGAMRRLAGALARALDASPEIRREAMRTAREQRDTLRGLLAADDYRYLEFQLWQEGVARFTEYAVARAAESRKPSAAFSSLPDYEPYRQAAERARRDLRLKLEQLDLGRDRRVAFYPIGAAWALLLDETRPGWKQAYRRRPFVLPD
jgi:hypothetical protein